MEYRLSLLTTRKLKTAGFLTNFSSSIYYKDGEEKLFVPALHDLLDWCGDTFDVLERTLDYYVQNDDNSPVMWRAYMTDEAFDKTGIDCVRDCDGYEIGHTPEEAVAELALLLRHYKVI